MSHLIHYKAVGENEVDRGENRERKARSMHRWTTRRKGGPRRNPITDQTKQFLNQQMVTKRSIRETKGSSTLGAAGTSVRERGTLQAANQPKRRGKKQKEA